MKKPIAITMGDPAGIGPEVILKGFETASKEIDRPICVVGDSNILSFYKEMLQLKTPEVLKVDSVEDIVIGAISVLEPHTIGSSWDIAKVSKATGEAAFSYIDNAIKLALNNDVAAVTTAPINKEALLMAGYNYPGHTEIFAEKCAVDNFTMLFKVENVSVVHVTTHCSLKKALETISEKKVVENILLLESALCDMGIKDPRIAVAGVNPHAGEGGLFGTEEIEHIIPAIEKARSKGVNCCGPYPPDTVFMKSFKGEFDGVVAMLHDHGFVALKSRNFEDGVNITLGLPIIRTSVGHGTGFDIAGKNLASPSSLIAALKAADSMATEREKRDH